MGYIYIRQNHHYILKTLYQRLIYFFALFWFPEAEAHRTQICQVRI
jgi:hypothetical protein